MSFSEFSSMSTGEVIGTLILSLAITVVCYCTIPTIIRFTLIKKKELSRGVIIGIAIANSVVIFAIVNIFTYSGNGVSIGAPILWGLVNYGVMTGGNHKYHKKRA